MRKRSRQINLTAEIVQNATTNETRKNKNMTKESTNQDMAASKKNHKNMKTYFLKDEHRAATFDLGSEKRCTHPLQDFLRVCREVPRVGQVPPSDLLEQLLPVSRRGPAVRAIGRGFRC